MMSSKIFTLFIPTLLVSVALAAPHLAHETFSITQIKRGNILMNGPLEMAKMYTKFGVDMPSDVVAALSKAESDQDGDDSSDQDGDDSSQATKRSVAAVPEDAYDTLYLSPVTLGSNTLHLTLDTGSADLWVFSTQLPAGQTNGQSLYNPAKSGTLLSGQSWSVTYADGSGASGNVFADQVVVGEVTATRQAVEAATSASSLFIQDTTSDGVMGLASSAINQVKPNQQQTFFDTVKARLRAPLFTSCLRKGAAGTFDFGFLNTSLYTGQITYTSVLTAPRFGFWNFNATGYAIGTGKVVSKAIGSIADTGTSLLYLPSDVVAAFYAGVSGAAYSSNYGGWVLPCNSKPPLFNAVIGGAAQTVPGSYLIYGPVDYSGNCFGGMQENTGLGFSIFGANFLKSQYVVFDGSTSPYRLGFAKQAGVVYS